MFGDSGAYLIGFLSALDLVQITNEIELLSKYFAIMVIPNLMGNMPNWTFPIIRKKNPLFPDGNHLHLLLMKINKQNHFKTSLQLNFLNLILFSLGSIYHNDDVILVFFNSLICNIIQLFSQLFFRKFF